MKKLYALCVWMAVLAVLLSAPAGFTAFAAEPASPVKAGAVVLMEADSGRIFYSQNETEAMPMASTTKIMTALLALEQPELDTYFTVDSAAIRTVGSSMGLREGDRATLRVLCYGMMLASGNDAANAAAVRIAGSIPAFVELMNLRAAEIGMENTTFVTPSGLDADGHQSTALDMAVLAREALQNPEFADICSQASARLEYGNPPYSRSMTNHNKLLRQYDWIDGVKTGYTQKAGRCLVSSAERDGIRLICVTLDCADDWTVHTDLYEAYFSALERRPLPGIVPDAQQTVTGGAEKTVALVPEREPSIVVLPDEDPALTAEIRKAQFVFAPIEKGDRLGELLVYADGILAETVPLVAADSIPAAEWNSSFPACWRELMIWFWK